MNGARLAMYNSASAANAIGRDRSKSNARPRTPASDRAGPTNPSAPSGTLGSATPGALTAAASAELASVPVLTALPSDQPAFVQVYSFTMLRDPVFLPSRAATITARSG